MHVAEFEAPSFRLVTHNGDRRWRPWRDFTLTGERDEAPAVTRAGE